MTPAFQSLYDESVGLAMDRQSFLSIVLADVEWEFDMGQGVMLFESATDRHVVPCQVLGTESAISSSWLWSWANDGSAIPAPLLGSARRLHQMGVSRAIPELISPTSELTHVDGHLLSVVASAFHQGCSGYYRAPYEGGALFVLLFGEELVEPPAVPWVRLAAGWSRTLDAVGETISDHRRAVAAYGRSLGLEPEAEQGQVRFGGSNGAAVVSFDDEGRTTGISTKSTG